MTGVAPEPALRVRPPEHSGGPQVRRNCYRSPVAAPSQGWQNGAVWALCLVSIQNYHKKIMPDFGVISSIKGAIKGIAAKGAGGGDVSNAPPPAAAGWNIRYEEFGLQKQKSSVDEAGGGGGDYPSSPDSIPEPDRPPLRHIDKYIRPECPCLSKRVTVAVLTCLGFIIMFGMRCNMGMAKMGLNKEKPMKLRWSTATSSAVESSIFWGYFVTQIPGGFLAAKYPPNRLFGLAIGCSSLLHFFVPSAMEMESTTIVITLRVTQGLVEGVTYPSCHGIWRHWAPPLERSRLATLAFCGCYAGVMFAMPITGELIKRIGWHAPFYFYGGVGVVWYLSWLWLVFEKPCKHPTIEARELMYIENSLGKSAQTHVSPSLTNTPWKELFSSMPVYAIFVANFCRSYNFYLLVLFQAQYFTSRWNMDIEKNAFLGALPHLLMTIIVPSGGVLADYLRKQQILTTTQVRKLFNCGGFGMEATFFLVVAYASSSTAAVVALSFGVAFSGFAISGFNVNHLDIAPKYASILMGMSNGIGSIAGCICPYLVGLILSEKTEDEWTLVFIMAAIVHYIGIVFYGVFASGELQPWAESKSMMEDKQWNPYDAAFQGEIKKSSSVQSNGLLQRQLSGKNASYGSVDAPSPPPPPVVSAGNPFVSTNPFRQEPVQPAAQDVYMHGTPEDRTY